MTEHHEVTEEIFEPVFLLLWDKNKFQHGLNETLLIQDLLLDL